MPAAEGRGSDGQQASGRMLQFRQVSKKQQEIADAVGMARKTVDDRLTSLADLDKCPKSPKIAALFEDDFKAPLYNVWRFTKSSNLVQSS
jgi:hypothetical protein